MCRLPKIIGAVLLLVLALTAAYFISLPSLTKTVPKGATTSVAMQGMRIANLLTAFADRNKGRYPKRLEDLVEAGLAAPEELSIDLLDQTPLRWIYNDKASRNNNSWLLLSPPIVNTVVTAEKRKDREREGGLQYASEKAMRVLVYADGHHEVFNEGELRSKLGAAEASVN